MSEEFAGLTMKNCCTACTAEKCVITGENICGHPKKGGIQNAHRDIDETKARFHRAQDYLGIGA